MLHTIDRSPVITFSMVIMHFITDISK